MVSPVRPRRERACRIVVMASGTGTNLQALLAAEAAGRLGGRIVAVLSDRPEAGALVRARVAGKPAVVLEPAGSRDRAILAELERWQPDLVVLAGFMRILGPAVVAAYRHRILNIHPSLLPAFPGKDAPRRALEHGVKVTGCTVHFVDEGVDTGPILLQAAVPVLDGDDPVSLHRRIQRVEHRLYPVAVRLVASGRVRIEGRRVWILPAVPEVDGGGRVIPSRRGRGTRPGSDPGTGEQEGAGAPGCPVGQRDGGPRDRTGAEPKEGTAG